MLLYCIDVVHTLDQKMWEKQEIKRENQIENIHGFAKKKDCDMISLANLWKSYFEDRICLCGWITNAGMETI